MAGYKRKLKEPANAGPKKAAKTASDAASSEEKSSSAESKQEPTVSVDDHPLQNGHYLVVKYRDGSNRLAKIIEGSAGASPRSTQYYIHYCDFNRRMDEWIGAPRIVAYPSEANPMGVAREAQENAAKKVKSVDSSGNLAEAEHKLPEASPPPAPLASPRSLLGSGSQRSGGQKSRSNSMVGGGGGMGGMGGMGGGISMAISTVADMEHDEHEGMDEESLLEHEAVTKIKNIKYVKLGRYIMECWYFSPFPPEYYPGGYAECLYFCEFSFRFFRTKEELQRYQKKPTLPRHPPGNEIYRDNDVSMFELDGAVEKVYCQNLCYFAKLFLDHKTLYWDVDPFLFYVLCTRDERGFHPVGYFSKEKYSDMGYNLACILTFPCVQRSGYGRFLMAFSYELSKKEEKAGSPEKPLSDLGAVGYKSYWANAVLKTLRDYQGQMISIMDITRLTSILPEDVQSTLTMLNLVHNISRAGDVGNAVAITCATGVAGESGETEGKDAPSTQSVLYAPLEHIESLLLKFPEGKLPVQPEKLHWAPLYVMEAKKDKWSIRSLMKDPKDGSSKTDAGTEVVQT